MDEELILTHEGKLEEGLYPMSEEIESVFKTGIKDIDPSALSGGIIYVHANIPEGFFNYKNSFLTALFLSALVINGNLEKYTVAELITRISSTGLVDQMFLEKQFYDYDNRELSLMVGPTMFRIPLNKQMKLLFCRLDLAQSDLAHSEKSIKEQKESKERIVSWMQTNFGVKSFYEAFENELQVDLNQFDLGLEPQQKQEHIKYFVCYSGWPMLRSGNWKLSAITRTKLLK